jgi:hypothetical protein
VSDGPLSLHAQAWLIAALIALRALAMSTGPAQLDIDVAGAPEDEPAVTGSCASAAGQEAGYLSDLATLLVRTNGGEGTELPSPAC